MSLHSALRCLALSLVFAFAIGVSRQMQAADRESVLVAFTDSSGPTPGAHPFLPNLIRDAAGTLYGTSSGGGNPNCVQLYGHECGVIFRLTHSGGAWQESVLYNFQGGADGSAAGTLVMDGKGNLYAVTSDGGRRGYGTFARFSPTLGTLWNKKVLHSFTTGKSGAVPDGNLVADAAGNFYGSTAEGGNVMCSMGVPPAGCGVVFKMSHPPQSGWKETVLYTFANLADGLATVDLTLDARGNLYGVTVIGGPDPNAGGTVFKLSPTFSGPWQKTILYTFIYGPNGVFPYAGAIFDSAGNLYGTTTMGGDMNCGHGGCGIVYKLTPTPSGPWQETQLHVFESGSDGASPYDRLALDAQGNLYGTTQLGGTGCDRLGCGIVFELANGSWTESILHSFVGGIDARNPYSGLILDPAGNLFGTTFMGGNAGCGGVGCGTVYEISAAP